MGAPSASGPAAPARGSASAGPGPQEPVWLVRLALVLFFVAFAGYLGRELWVILR